MKNILFIVTLLLLGGCVSSVPVKSVEFTGTTSVKSDMSASIHLNTGVITGSSEDSMVMISPGIFVPISSGPYPHLQFNEKNQKSFTSNLKSELLRLGLFKKIILSSKNDLESDLQIELIFAQTHHNPNYQQYVLDVAMVIVNGAKKYSSKYRVISDEGDSWWTKMNTNAYEGKEKAARKLMNLLVADINNFIETE